MAAVPRGFTLVELIVVMVVMAALASVALPRLLERRALDERGFQDQLLAALRHARQAAVTQQREVCVRLQPGGTRTVDLLFATAGGACNPALPVSEPGTSQAWVLALPATVTLSGAPLVRFTSTGRLTPYANVGLSVGAMAALTVDRETGVAR